MPDKCPDNCPLIPRVDALERENEQHSETHREIFRRVGTLETQAAVQENKLDTVILKQDTIITKLEALEAKPGKRWESLIGYLITAIAAFLLAKLGL